ncbi:SDR family oxidoreductase [Maribacter sp. 1_MG-2023]|uniref:SDR family oxidoreductase n=1 Tax=Maribacter sp. 1_MG-2023 TaxID=3062677 RepID=UPI0026E46A1B|nr:SDR family oxidoreductase [Maribacter sp. 1_MG-2023]MDO6473292.1 SDR family oxidoreductase [Maribacter sp. 1_MG-2023]
MKIAVTSASGKLGASIVKHLINLIGKENVIGIARTVEKATYLGVEIRKGDYNSREDFNSALQGVDAVLLVSGMDEPQKRIQQHRNVIEAAKQNGVKKIVYTSIVGDEDKNAFSPIVKSNRQTEKDVQASGLQWVIGRNGIYIEPDLEYIHTYVKEGRIENCAGQGKCTYTSREELGYAYAKLLIEDKHNGQVYNLVGEPVTQSELAENINKVYGTNVIYNSVTVNNYAADRKAALGDFMGTVIAGIYEGIKAGANNVPSDFEKATGRAPKSLFVMISEFKNNSEV